MKDPKTLSSKLFETFLTRSWWVILFVIASFAGYEQAAKKCSEDFSALSERRTSLLEAKELAKNTNARLRRQIASQTDRAWVEITLMKGLGLVPSGQQKVFFENSDGAS